MDFGSICTTTEGTATIGVDLNDADGVAYPYDSCSGGGASDEINNVVRKAKSPNPTIPEDAVPGSDGLGVRSVLLRIHGHSFNYFLLIT